MGETSLEHLFKTSPGRPPLDFRVRGGDDVDSTVGVDLCKVCCDNVYLEMKFKLILLLCNVELVLHRRRLLPDLHLLDKLLQRLLQSQLGRVARG